MILPPTWGTPAVCKVPLSTIEVLRPHVVSNLNLFNGSLYQTWNNSGIHRKTIQQIQTELNVPHNWKCGEKVSPGGYKG